MFSVICVYLPAIVTDAHADAHARSAEADAGARPVVIVAALLDIPLAGSIIVGIAVTLLDNHAPRSTGSVATAGVIANHAYLLHVRLIHTEIRGASTHRSEEHTSELQS